jgi:hypothetical protein
METKIEKTVFIIGIVFVTVVSILFMMEVIQNNVYIY